MTPHPLPNAAALASLADAAKAFSIPGEFVDLVPHRRGHIHDTYISAWRENGTVRRYLHQRMNDRVFEDLPALMHNISRVTSHLAAKLDGAADGGDGFQTLRLVHTHEDGHWVRHETGAWRTYHFIEGTESFDLCRSPEQAFEAARVFGRFQAQLIDLDVGDLHETIPNFFSSPHRLQQFDAVVEADPEERVSFTQDEIAFVEARRDLVDAIAGPMRDGRIPTRIVHGDTKLNNVLFERDTGRAVCIVDLDTCMPGYSLYDFGDLVRFTAATSAEDEVDLDLAGMDLALYRALVEGYLEDARSFLTDEEIELMPTAARLVTFTIGLRFLTDHLAGDVYFKTERPGHNLDRARVQFRMVESMERQARTMRVE